MDLHDKLKNVDIRTVDKNTLVDIADITIDKSLSPEERKKQFVEQVKNPYCFICNGFIVKSKFAETGNSFNDCFENYIKLNT